MEYEYMCTKCRAVVRSSKPLKICMYCGTLYLAERKRRGQEIEE